MTRATVAMAPGIWETQTERSRKVAHHGNELNTFFTPQRHQVGARSIG